MASARIAQTGVTATTGVIAGFTGLGALGLIGATLIGYASGLLVAASASLRSIRTVSGAVSLSRLRAIGARYKSFPLQSVPGAFADVLALQLPAIIIAHSYESAVVGHFGLTLRVAGIPSVVVGYAVGQVYYQSIAKAAARGEPVSRQIKQAARLLMLVALVPYGVLVLFGAPLFGFVFGAVWWQAGVFASILGPAYWIRFVASSLSLSLPALNRNDLAMRWQMLNLVTVVAALGIAAQYSVTTFMAVFCVQYLLVYGYYLWLIFRAAQQQETFS